MTRAAIVLSALLLAAAWSDPAAAQGTKAKKKAPPPPPKVIVYSLDLFRLSAGVNHDGVDQPTMPLADKNTYGETRVFGATSALVWKQRFRGRERLVLSLSAHRAIQDLKFELSHGRMLAPDGPTGRALKPIAPLETCDLEAVFEGLEAALKVEDDEAVVAAVRKARGLGWDSSMGMESARGRLLRWRKLLAMRTIENMLVKAEILAEKDRPLAELTFDEATGDAIARLAEGFETRVERELWWQVKIEYFFAFGSIGRDLTEGPPSAFIPGSLGGGVSSITVVTRPRSGERRVLWYRLPGYNKAEQSLDLQLPKGWLSRLFSPGKESGGALLFVVVPASQRGEIEFLWKLNANTGARLRVERPEPSPSPF